MNAVILACSSLNRHVDAAQAKMNTAFPVINVDRRYHESPAKMKEQVIKAVQNLAPEVDTVLVAMGFCGGSWKDIVPKKRIVIPRMDDCITLLLHSDDTWHSNLKKTGHFYLTDSDSEFGSLTAMQQSLCDKYGDEDGQDIFQMWFAPYTDVDVIDTGVYDCHSREYTAEAKKNADLIQGRLNYVNGSNLLLEKLVSGRWDQQFLVAEPGRMITDRDFISEM